MNRNYSCDYLTIRGGQKRYEVVSFLRGFSILTIVLMHLIQNYIKACPSMISKGASLGGTGVHVFFLCSGFGLYLSQRNRPVRYWQFLRKRFGKIYIPYIIIVLISAMLPFMYEGNHIKALLSHVFLYKMFIPEYESSFGGQLWYISTLFQFYLAFIPLCELRKRIGNRCFCICCFAVSVIWWCFAAVSGLGTERIWGSFFLQYLWEFAIGMEIADRLESGAEIRIKRSWLIAGAFLGVGLATVAKMAGGVFTLFNDVPALIGYGAIALLLYGIRNGLVNSAIMFLSDISYELYLVHILVFTVMFRITGAEGALEYVVAIASFFIAVVLASLYHWLLTASRSIMFKG